MKSWIYNAACAPGQVLNLLAGGCPDFDRPLMKTLFSGELSAIAPLLEKTPENCPFGPELILTPCEDWTALTAAFYRHFQIEGRGTSWFSGAAIQAHSSLAAEHRRILLEQLGLSEEDTAEHLHYVLAEIPRNLTTSPITMSDAFRQSCVQRFQSQLASWQNRQGLSETPETMQSLLQLICQDTGTHILNSLSLGDCAVQVFVYDEENYQAVCRTMELSGWSGIQALAFRFFTSRAYCQKCGRIGLLSQDPVLDTVRPLMTDPLYNIPESLFSIILNKEVQIQLIAAGRLCCTGFTAQPLSAWLAAEDNKTAELISQLVIQGGVTRFGQEAAGPVWPSAASDIPNYFKLYADFLTSASPVMRSPYTSVFSMVIRLKDWFHQNAVNAQDIRHLMLTADVLIIDEDLDLSCCEDLLFSCRRLLCPDAKAAVLTVSAAGFRQFNLYCGEMNGSLIVNDPSDPEHHQIVYGTWAAELSPGPDDICCTTFFRGHFPTAVFINPQKTELIRWQQEALQNGLQALLLSASVPVHVASYTEASRLTAIEAWKCLDWIRTYAGQYLDEIAAAHEKPNEAMSWLFTEAVTLIRGSHDPADEAVRWPSVPALRYTAYQETVDRLLTLSRDIQIQLQAAQQRIDDFNAELRRSYQEEQRDENLRKLAQFMLDQNAAVAQKEADMSAAYARIIHQQEDLVQTLTIRQAEITAQYAAYSSDLKTKKTALDKAIEKALEKERAKASMEFIFGLTEAVLGIVSGSFNFALLGSESVDIKKTAMKWDAFLKYAQETNKIITISETLADYVQKINDLDKVTVDAEMPTENDWNAFLLECEVNLNTCSSLIPTETGEYLNVIKNLIRTASSLNQVVDQIAAAQREIFAQQAMQKVADDQQKRLEALTLELHSPDWKPDTSVLTDLGQLEAALAQRQTRALLMVSDLVRLQDESMTYHYLSQPSVITHFDLLSIEETLASQARAAVKALENYPYPPTDLGPLDFEFTQLSSAQLLSPEGVLIEPSMHQGLFRNLARVRINAMDLRIKGLKTNSGRCHVFIETLSDPMLDRGLHQEILTYQMISRRWVVVYDTVTGKTIMDTRPAEEWGKYFTKPTPFQKMRIRLASVEDNAGATLPEETCEIQLSLMLEACPSYNQYQKKKRTAVSDEPFVSKLKGLSITDGWDVVSFVSLDKINQLWNDRWQAEQNPDYPGYKQFLQHIQCHLEEKPVFSTLTYDLDAILGAPNLTFRDQTAEVTIPILEGSLIITETSASGSQSVSYAFSSEKGKQASLMTQVDLKELTGAVNERSVAIQVNSGAFLLKDFTISEIIDVKLADMITTFFKKETIPPWELGCLKLDTDIPFLKPTQFFFRTYTQADLFEKTEEHVDVLALYILTVTKEVPSFGMRRTWPKNSWIVSKTQDAAVYFSASLLWNHEIQPALSRDIGPVNVTSVTSGLISWKAQFTGTIEVYNGTAVIKEGYETGGNYQNVTEHAKVNFPMDNITVDMTMDSICTHCHAAWKDQFPYQGRTVLPDPECPNASLYADWDDVNFTCIYEASTQAQIDPQTFIITFKPIQAEPKVEAVYPTKRPWYISSGTVSEEIVKAAKSKITEKLAEPKINLTAMPMFAVCNLLFPNSKVMEPEAVYFPNDLVIVGTGAIPQHDALRKIQNGLKKLSSED